MFFIKRRGANLKNGLSKFESVAELKPLARFLRFYYRNETHLINKYEFQ